ncbi:MAG: hypothetical protein WC554_17120 [Clostridia bacterium]
MNLMDISHDDWQYLFKCYPGLEARMINCALWNEARRLTQERKGMNNNWVDPRRKTWVESRLLELNKLISGE